MDDRDDLRASDQDRERIAAQLHTAAADGRITLAEMDERLVTLYAARTYGELVPLTRDLPAATDAGHRAAAPVIGATGPGVSIGLLSACERAGDWVVPPRHTAVAVLGAVELDLRSARVAAAQVQITAVAVLGSIAITVPHDAHVEVNGVGLLGGVDGRGAGGRPGAQLVRVVGVAVLGAVEVRRGAAPVEGAPRKELR